MAQLTKNALDLLEKRYYQKDTETGELIEHTPEEMFMRVAKTVAQAEKEKDRDKWTQAFFSIMNEQLFMPNTPTLIGAGRKKCLSACSVVGEIPDSLEDIYKYMWYNAKLTKYGCGVGQSLSAIRPKGEIIKSSGGRSAGVVNWMYLIDSVAKTTVQGDTARRAANMVSLRFNHPDVFDFIDSKLDQNVLTGMNISVIITDNEMEAVINDEEIWLEWGGKKYKKVKARDIYNKIVHNCWQNGEPNLLFIDIINNDNPFNLHDDNFNENNDHYITTTNPCGEQPLESFELCTLASINLDNMYSKETKGVAWSKLADTIETGIRFLDDVIDVNEYVLPEFKEKVLSNRKIGLGVTGFANLLIKMGIRYDSQEALVFIDKLFGFIKQIAERCNTELAEEKGCFPNWEYSIFAKKNIKRRNATITTQAPVGSVSTILGTEAYGIEPLFSVGYIRRIVEGEIFEVNQLFLQKLHQEVNNKKLEKKIIKECIEKGTTDLDIVPQELRQLFRCANDISPEWHVKVQAQIQKYYENAISKTSNLSEDATEQDVDNIFKLSWKLGNKGCTCYRNNSREGQTIQIGNKKETKQLDRGHVISAQERAEGERFKLRTGCGTLYLSVFTDNAGNITEVFTDIGQGNCISNTQALSRMVSLALRGGVPFEHIIDQLQSACTCPSYVVARAKGKGVSPGRSCPSAIAKQLAKVQKELKNIDKKTTKRVDKSEPTEYNLSKLQQQTELSEEYYLTQGICPVCQEQLQQAEGCLVCNCGWSYCG